MKKILLSIFLSTIFMANVVAMAGTCDDYNIETRNDNGVEVYSVLENDECNRDEAMAEIRKMLEVCISVTEDTIKMFIEKDLTYGGSVMEKEKYLDKLERKAIKNHMTRTKEGKCTGTVAMMYVDILSDLERIGDHAVNIVEHYTYKDLILTEEEENLDLSKFIIETNLED